MGEVGGGEGNGGWVMEGGRGDMLLLLDFLTGREGPRSLVGWRWGL